MGKPANPRRPWLWAVFPSGVLLALLVALTLPASARMPDGMVLEYRVMRHGAEIGRHWVRFRRLEDRLRVETWARIAVKFAFITIYSYELDGHEIWRDGRLIAVESTTNDNGDTYAVRATAAGDGVTVEAGGRRWSAPGTIVPSSLWRRDMTLQTVLLGVEQGRRLEVEIEEVGSETVSARGRQVSATHYVVSGDLARELWCDDDGVLVHLRFKRHGGEEIVYVLR